MTRVLTPFFKGKFPYFAPHTAPPAEEHSHDEENDGDEEKHRRRRPVHLRGSCLDQAGITKDKRSHDTWIEVSIFSQPGTILDEMGPRLQLSAAGLVLLIYVVVLRWMKKNAFQQQYARLVRANADGNVLVIAAANAADQEGTQQNIQASKTEQDTQGSTPQQKEVRTMDAPEARKEEDDTQAAALGQQADETRRLTARTGIQAGDVPSPQGAGVILLENQAESGALPCQGLKGKDEEEAPTKRLIPDEQFDVDLVGETEQEDKAELSPEGVKRDLAQDKVLKDPHSVVVGQGALDTAGVLETGAVQKSQNAERKEQRPGADVRPCPPTLKDPARYVGSKGAASPVGSGVEANLVRPKTMRDGQFSSVELPPLSLAPLDPNSYGVSRGEGGTELEWATAAFETQIVTSKQESVGGKVRGMPLVLKEGNAAEEHATSEEQPGGVTLITPLRAVNDPMDQISVSGRGSAKDGVVGVTLARLEALGGEQSAEVGLRLESPALNGAITCGVFSGAVAVAEEGGNGEILGKAVAAQRKPVDEMRPLLSLVLQDQGRVGRDNELCTEREKVEARKATARLSSRAPQAPTSQAPARGRLKRAFLSAISERYTGEERKNATDLAVRSLSPESECLDRLGVRGQGCSGRVVIVRSVIGRIFALKEVPEEAGVHARNAARAEMETLTSFRNSHQNIIGVLAMDDSIPTMPILLQYAHHDMFSVVDDGHNYSMHQKTSLLLDTARGVQYMHQHLGKVHCDLKLDNILCVRRANRFMQGKICDFGLTRGIGETREAMTGTMGNIPIENLRENLPSATNQDVFTLGVIMLQTLVLPELKQHNMFTCEELLGDEEKARYDDIYSGADIDAEEENYFECDVMERTMADGSFEKQMVIPANLQSTVPLKKNVCTWIMSCLSTTPSARVSTERLIIHLQILAGEAALMERES